MSIINTLVKTFILEVQNGAGYLLRSAHYTFSKQKFEWIGIKHAF